MVKMQKSILGGIPMIADDMMSFIKKDIIVFGLGVFCFHYYYFMDCLQKY